MIKEKKLQAPVHYNGNKDYYYRFVEESLTAARSIATDECFKYLDPAFNPNENRFQPGMVLENLASTKNIGEAVDKDCQLALSIVTKVEGDNIYYCNMNDDENEVCAVYYSRTLFPVSTYRELSLKLLRSIKIDENWRQMILNKCWPEELPRSKLNVEDIEDSESLEKTSDSDQEPSDSDQGTSDNDSEYAPSEVTSIEELSKSSKRNRHLVTSNELLNPKRPVRNVRKSTPLVKDGQLVHGTLSKNNLSIDDNRKRLAFEDACRRSGPGSSGFKAPMLLKKLVAQDRNLAREAPTTIIRDIVNQNGEDQTADSDDPDQILRDLEETSKSNHQLMENFKKLYADVFAENENYLSRLLKSNVGGSVPERESQEQNEESPDYHLVKLEEELAYQDRLIGCIKKLRKQARETNAHFLEKFGSLKTKHPTRLSTIMNMGTQQVGENENGHRENLNASVPSGRVPRKRTKETCIGNEEDTAMDFLRHPLEKKGCRNELDASR